MLLLLSCIGDKGDTADSSQEETGYLYVLTNYWMGEAEVVPDVSYLGSETYYHNKGVYPAGTYACILSWEMEGIPSTKDPDSCVGCIFRFEIQARPQSGTQIVNDGTCDDYFSTDMTFHYGYTPDYQGHGPSMMYYSADYFQWFAWIRDGDTIYETPQKVQYEENRFSYEGGFLDYYYYSDREIAGAD